MKKLLVLSSIICAFVLPKAHATNIGGLLGFGHYWAESGVSGFTLNGFVDINVTGNFNLTPNLSFWTGSVEGEGVSDFTPSFTFKFAFPSAVTVPFVGFGPNLHILSAGGESETYFGFCGLGGLVISLSPNLGMPVQASYGLIFGEAGTLNIFTAKIGIATKI